MIAAKLALGIALIALTTTISAYAADEELYYGSRAGMSVTVISKKGIGSSNATIKVKHLPKNAKAFCVEYVLDHSMACVRRTMAEVRVNDRVTANCKKKTWADLSGQRYAFLGRHKSGDLAPDYAIRDLQTGDMLDGSSASGYDTALSIFRALCPGIAK